MGQEERNRERSTLDTWYLDLHILYPGETDGDLGSLFALLCLV